MIRSLATVCLLLASGASAEIADDVSDGFVACFADKQLANELVRGCPRWHDFAVSELIEGWRADGQLERVRETFAAQGLDDLSELRLNPYVCVVPEPLLMASEEVRRGVEARITARRAELLTTHGFAAGSTLADVPEEAFCDAIDLAIADQTDLITALKEYGIE